MPITANEWIRKTNKAPLLNYRTETIRKVYKPARIFKHIIDLEGEWGYSVVSACADCLILASTAFITWDGAL